LSVVVDEALRATGGARHLGEFILRERLAKGLQQAELAARAGMAASDISAMEKGRRLIFRPPVTLLERIADGLAGEDLAERGRILRAMLLLAGMKPESLDAVLSFDGAMNLEAEVLTA
jgi:transcriptional regulator with XRE-family HTH domain